MPGTAATGVAALAEAALDLVVAMSLLSVGGVIDHAAHQRQEHSRLGQKATHIVKPSR